MTLVLLGVSVTPIVLLGLVPQLSLWETFNKQCNLR